MLVGLGLDVIEVDRIQRAMRSFKGRFRTKIFTPGEIAHCSEAKRPSLAYAARWAAKEACMKALGTGWQGGVSFLEIEVVNDASGKPSLVLTGAALARLEALGNPSIFVSMSDTRRTAAAVVALER